MERTTLFGTCHHHPDILPDLLSPHPYAIVLGSIPCPFPPPIPPHTTEGSARERKRERSRTTNQSLIHPQAFLSHTPARIALQRSLSCPGGTVLRLGEVHATSHKVSTICLISSAVSFWLHCQSFLDIIVAVKSILSQVLFTATRLPPALLYLHFCSGRAISTHPRLPHRLLRKFCTSTGHGRAGPQPALFKWASNPPALAEKAI